MNNSMLITLISAATTLALAATLFWLRWRRRNRIPVVDTQAADPQMAHFPLDDVHDTDLGNDSPSWLMSRNGA